MRIVTQTILYRQALIKYAEKYGVTKAAIRYKTNTQFINHRVFENIVLLNLFFIFIFSKTINKQTNKIRNGFTQKQ